MVRPGRNGWVAGDLSWARLEALRLGRGYREPHLRLLRELYGLYQASNDLGGYGYRYGQDRWMEFSAIGSRQLWPLLDEAAAAGLSLVHPGRDDGPAGYGEAGFCLDVTRGEDGGLQIIPVVRNGAGDAGVPALFIGAEGHGVVCLDRDQATDGDPARWPFRLFRLTRPVPPALQRMALLGTPLRVPAADEPRFLRQYYPRLRQAAELTCSDGSVTLPSISGPELVLQASYGDDHRLDLSWEWQYRIGDIAAAGTVAAGPAGRRVPRRRGGTGRAGWPGRRGSALARARAGPPDDRRGPAAGRDAAAARPSSPAWPPCGSAPSCCPGCRRCRGWWWR